MAVLGGGGGDQEVCDYDDEPRVLGQVPRICSLQREIL